MEPVSNFSLYKQSLEILKLSRQIIAATTEEEVTRTLVQGLRELLDFDMVAIYFAHEASSLFYPTIVNDVSGNPGIYSSWVIPLNKGIIGHALKTGKPEFVTNAHQDPRSVYPDNSAVPVEQLMVFPLNLVDSCWGVLALNRYSDKYFVRHEYEGAENLASYASLALSNISLMKQLKEKEKKKQAVLQAIPDAILRVKMISGQLRFYDYEGKELETPDFLDQDDSEFPDLYQKAISSGQTASYEHKMLQEGQLHYYETRFVPISSQQCLSITRDITEIRTAKQALSRSEAFKNTILDTISDAVISVNRKGKMVMINEAAERVFGYSHEEMTDQNLQMLIPDYFREIRRRSAEQYDEYNPSTPHNLSFELVGVHKNGARIPIEVSFGECVIDGEAVYTSVIRDISERKKYQENIRSSTMRLTKLIQTIQAGVLVEDENRKVVLCNQQFCDLFQLQAAPETLEGTDFVPIAEECKKLFDDPAVHIAGMSKLIEVKSTRINEQMSFRDNRFIERDFIPIHIDDAYHGHMWVYRDITERKKAEIQLSQLARLAEENPNPSLRMTENHEVQDSNTAGLMLLEAFDTEPSLSTSLRDMVQDSLAHSKVMEKEFFLPGIDRHYIINFVPVPGRKYVNVYGRDITELKRTQQDLVKAKMLAEESMKAKQEFLAKMSHELRTPMNGVLGLTNLILTKPDGHESLEYLNSIKSSGEHLLAIINDILDLSKMEAGKLQFEELVFKPGDLLQAVQNNMLILARQKGIELNITKDDNVPNYLWGDRVRVNQILINLVSNAIKFTEKGHVNVTCSAGEQKDDVVTLRFEVTDTGIGIPADKLDKIFESFSQGDKGIAAKFGGTGLGLAIVKQLTEMQHGTVSVKSAPGNGSQFIVELPFRVATTTPQEIARDEDLWKELPSFENVRILLVEDNPVNQLVGLKTLELWNIHVTIASNGLEAVNQCTHSDFDLVIMDIQMPEMDGIEATKAIRSSKDQRKRNVPILAMTASVLPDSLGIVYQAGVNDHISKPFKFHELHQKLCSLLNVSTEKSGPSPDKKNKRKGDGMTNVLPVNNHVPFPMNSEEESELVSIITTTIPGLLNELSHALQEKEEKACKKSIHKLKGSFGIMGNDNLYEDASFLENNVNKIREADYRRRAESLIKKTEKLLTEIANRK